MNLCIVFIAIQFYSNRIIFFLCHRSCHVCYDLCIGVVSTAQTHLFSPLNETLPCFSLQPEPKRISNVTMYNSPHLQSSIRTDILIKEPEVSTRPCLHKHLITLSLVGTIQFRSSNRTRARLHAYSAVHRHAQANLQKAADLSLCRRPQTPAIPANSIFETLTPRQP